MLALRSLRATAPATVRASQRSMLATPMHTVHMPRAASDLRSLHSSRTAQDSLPLKELRDILVLSKDVAGPAPPGAPKKPTTAADFLTLMSQIILVGSTGFLLFCAAYPETISNRLEEYKEQLTKRRHDRMLEFMMSDRPYLTGDLKDQLELAHEKGAANTSLLFKGEIYHTEIADNIKKVLLQGPINRYGIITGPTGSGKSRLIRELVRDETHYAVLSMGLVSGVKSLVDALSEELGYDFDDWTERMLQGYLFNGSSLSFPTQMDKLAFLLDEFEEACWSLKFDGKNGAQGKRPVLVLDDVDLLDYSDKETQQAVRMLFNAANKWSREDTALIVFTAGQQALMTGEGELAKLVRSEVLDVAKVYNVGALSHKDADRFLRDKLGHAQGEGAIDREKIQSVVGSKLFDMLKVCDDMVKTRDSVDSVLKKHLEGSITKVGASLGDVSNALGEGKTRAAMRWLDALTDIPVSAGNPKSRTLFGEAHRKGYGPAMKILLDLDILSCQGTFSSDLFRNAYRRYRNMPIVYTPRVEKKRGWFW